MVIPAWSAAMLFEAVISRDGYRALRRFAHRWPHARWAIEGAAGLGAPLTTLLRTDGIEVIDVPAQLAARVRVLSSGHGRKNDDADARSVGIAALTSHALGTAEIDAATTALRAVVEHRDDLVKTRTQTVNRLHVVLTRLVSAGARRHLSADHAAELLRGVRPRDAAAKTLRALAMDLVSEVRQLDRRIAKAANDIQMAVSASGTTLTELHGLGALTAGKILGRVGDVSRFRSAAAFASYTGTAPIEVSSGEVVRHRLSRAGDRQLNFCLHVMALAQVRHNTPGRGLLPAETIRRKSPRSHALLETPPVRRRVPTADRRRSQPKGGPGRTFGGGSIVSRGQLIPRTPALQTSHFPSPPPNPTTRHKPTT
jgi:transposase